jgi:hypothetical protein
MLAARMIDKPILRTAIMPVIGSRCLCREWVLSDPPSTISRFSSVASIHACQGCYLLIPQAPNPIIRRLASATGSIPSRHSHRQRPGFELP